MAVVNQQRTMVYSRDSMATFNPPLIYRLFFLYIEPTSALVGAYYAAFQPNDYLSLLTPSSTPVVPTSEPTAVLASLYQLANLYLLFALVERLVLSSTSSLLVWRRLLFCLLIADFGHLATMIPVALAQEDGLWRVFAQFWMWNAMEWGSVGFVYGGAAMRLSFLVLTSQWWRGSTVKAKEE